MRVERLRPPIPPDQLGRVYWRPHDHRDYGRDHEVRVQATIAVARGLLGPHVGRVADLSCGNGTIALALDPDAVLGDLAPGHRLRGAIEDTIHEIDHVDVFVCSETLEHLDDPAGVLADIRATARRLVLTTPIGCFDDDNPEHYWAWDRDGVEQLAEDAGWTPEVFAALDTTVMGAPYVFGIWVMR